MSKLMLTVATSLLLLVGCGNYHTPTSTTKTLPNGTIRVAWSSVGPRVQRAIMRVAKSYGDDHAKVAEILKAGTDSTPHQLMYVVDLSGHFHHGRVRSRYLEFSILGNGRKAWAIRQHGRIPSS